MKCYSVTLTVTVSVTSQKHFFDVHMKTEIKLKLNTKETLYLYL